MIRRYPQCICVWVIEICSLVIVCDLLIGFWNFLYSRLQPIYNIPDDFSYLLAEYKPKHHQWCSLQ